MQNAYLAENISWEVEAEVRKETPGTYQTKVPAAEPRHGMPFLVVVAVAAAAEDMLRDNSVAC